MLLESGPPTIILQSLCLFSIFWSVDGELGRDEVGHPEGKHTRTQWEFGKGASKAKT